jgi:phospholipase C
MWCCPRLRHVIRRRTEFCFPRSTIDLARTPYSRGPLKCSTVLDHTSQLKLLRKRFGVPVPNLSQWRDQTVGDVTASFDFAVPPNPSKPNLDHPLRAAIPKLPHCVPNAIFGIDREQVNPLSSAIPRRRCQTQETAPARGTPSGIC